MKVFTVMRKCSRQNHGEPLEEWYEAPMNRKGELKPFYKTKEKAENARNIVAESNNYLVFVVLETSLI